MMYAYLAIFEFSHGWELSDYVENVAEYVPWGSRLEDSVNIPVLLLAFVAGIYGASRSHGAYAEWSTSAWFNVVSGVLKINRTPYVAKSGMLERTVRCELTGDIVYGTEVPFIFI